MAATACRPSMERSGKMAGRTALTRQADRRTGQRRPTCGVRMPAQGVAPKLAVGSSCSTVPSAPLSVAIDDEHPSKLASAAIHRVWDSSSGSASSRLSRCWSSAFTIWGPCLPYRPFCFSRVRPRYSGASPPQCLSGAVSQLVTQTVEPRLPVATQPRLVMEIVVAHPVCMVQNVGQ